MDSSIVCSEYVDQQQLVGEWPLRTDQLVDLDLEVLRADDDLAAAEVLELLLNQFRYDEPLCESLKIEREEAVPYFRDLIDACRAEPVSYIVRDHENGGKIVGASLNQVLRRDQPCALPVYPVGNAAGKYSPRVQQFCELVYVCESNMWRLLPQKYSTVVNIVFGSVAREYHRVNIGIQMFGFVELKFRHANHIDGTISELTAVGTQKIFARLGFYPILSVPYAGYRDGNGRQVINPSDGADSMQLVFKPYF